ncbi:hypothetical protein COY27_02995 [Candidatus Woesearchaeota archaeon CG_4_10_14_0_2_um_filter_33_13]|nr:MAG: hypothetical protein COY27_02995 [Candidatus Woesearchaeota archaeon CG_4_10_14_0_2_um_filter_33_13]
MSKKGAIGLSMDVLVIVIISLVILGAGVSLLYQFIGGATDIKTQLDTRTEAELERLLVDQGKMVALPLHVATIERGESHVFGIGIMNIGGVGDEFLISITLEKVADDFNKDITNQVDTFGVKNWLLYDDETLIIKEGQSHKESIVVNVPPEASVGQYIFNARVCSNLPCNQANQYGNTQKFYVNVK